MRHSTASARPLSLTLRVLARLLEYPDSELREHLDELRAALHEAAELPANRLVELDTFIDRLVRRAPLDGEADYVELFDRGRATSLLLFEHVHGDSRDRGPAMVDLVKTYQQAGLYLTDDDLPDHLTTMLEFASTQPPEEARALLGEIAHIVRQIFSALIKRESPYASLLAAVLELGGEQVRTVTIVADADLDESWEEPAAFDGCSIAGQARPGAAGKGGISGTGTAPGADPGALTDTARTGAVPEFPMQFIPPSGPGRKPSTRAHVPTTGARR